MMAAMAGTGVISETVMLFDVLNVCRCMSSSEASREKGGGTWLVLWTWPTHAGRAIRYRVTVV
jgi:hypothetical protein